MWTLIMDDQVIWRLIGVLIGVAVTVILGFVLKEAKTGTDVARKLQMEMIGLKTTTFPLIEGQALKERMAVMENDHKHAVAVQKELVESIKILNTHLKDFSSDGKRR